MNKIKMSKQEQINEPLMYREYLKTERANNAKKDKLYKLDSMVMTDLHAETRNKKHCIPLINVRNTPTGIELAYQAMKYTTTGIELNYMDDNYEIMDFHNWNDHYLMLVESKKTAMSIIVANGENTTIFQITHDTRKLVKNNLKKLVDEGVSIIPFLFNNDTDMFNKIVKVIRHENDAIEMELLELSGFIPTKKNKKVN